MKLLIATFCVWLPIKIHLLFKRWSLHCSSGNLCTCTNHICLLIVKDKSTAILFNPLLPKSDLQILLCLMPDNFTRQRETPQGLKGYKTISFNPLLPKSDLQILLCLTPDDFTCQRKTLMAYPFTPKEWLIDFTLSNTRRFYLSKGDPSGLKGLKNYLL